MEDKQPRAISVVLNNHITTTYLRVVELVVGWAHDDLHVGYSRYLRRLTGPSSREQSLEENHCHQVQ